MPSEMRLLAAALVGLLVGCMTSRHRYQFEVPRERLASPGSTTCAEQCRVDPQIDACLARCPGVRLVPDCDESSAVECISSHKTFRRPRAIGPIGIIGAAVVFGVAAGIGAAVNDQDGKDSYWYGVAAIDGVALGLGVAGAATDTEALGYGGLAVYAAGPPVLHASLNDRTHAYASLGLRLGLPAIFAAFMSIGSYLAECNPISLAVDRGVAATGNKLTEFLGTDDEPLELDRTSGACVGRRAKAAFVVGMAGAALLDAAIVAWKDGEQGTMTLPLFNAAF